MRYRFFYKSTVTVRVSGFVDAADEDQARREVLDAATGGQPIEYELDGEDGGMPEVSGPHCIVISKP